MLRKYVLTVLFILTLLLAIFNSQTFEPTSKLSYSDRPLTIWWNQGYFATEDKSIKKIVADWSEKSHIPVKLEIISENDIHKLAFTAIEAGNPPDILFSMRTDFELTQSWAWEGKLADVSDVVEPLQDIYDPVALRSAYVYNQKSQKFSYYAVPFKQSSVHLHYWRSLLNEAGFKSSDIPHEWDAFWDFWKQVQRKLEANGKQIYALALPMGTEATSDTFYGFEQFLEAYNVKILNEKGQLQLDIPEVRQGLIKVLEWVTNFYKDGYVPPKSVNWRPSDNNIEFLNQNAVVVENTTMSIPASQKTDQEIYFQQIETIEFPKKPDGQKMTSLVAFKQLVLFAESKHKKAAKNFLSYFVQPEILKTYFKNAAGRWYPVMPILWQDPFWINPADPHVFIAAKQLKENFTRPLNKVFNPAYSEVHRKNIWGQTMKRVVIDGLSPEAAADEAIEKIKDIFFWWQNIN
ncbi:ABC transporter substrate-binding protein [Mastigocoleus sp. MO_188.B34]|uniref:ABC transporter substrate-binding protein n=1 Tax=Mastigocoleus sp. MO_188.B34 TaxID=3036635 RepID=UPI002606A519|nr:ABC transporter substrate-binding protein [Mastigocoleus sp. MO_188.B34]MDJ0697901.1 ABC transporter substrate-binding protein [Mastigocoleus sp. MO_188.B34]